ncbi:MAG TPA: histone deacetylase [Desulfurivibrionaceae bacterium]|nr:histone deacetylase [Desulfurivibrionaceae bacterium]
MAKTAILKSDIFLEHDPGFAHVENPSRLEVIYEGLKSLAGREAFLFPDPEPATRADLLRIHSAEHVDRIAATAGKPYDFLDSDTATSAKSYAAAGLAAGAVIGGARLVTEGLAANAFALVRPPGHHAEKAYAKGFCLFNNIAVAAAFALAELGLKRVLIVDWDLHHGNGTQNSFYQTDQVLYFSTHMYPYYPGSGALQELGSGRGEGYNINVPLSGGMNDQAYAAIFNEVLSPIARQYKPEMIMVSAGYDIYHDDPLGTMAVSAVGFAYLTRVVKNLAAELCDGRLLLTLEGGYNLTGLRDGVLASLGELAGVAESAETAGKIGALAEAGFGRPGGLAADSLATLRRAYAPYWQI